MSSDRTLRRKVAAEEKCDRWDYESSMESSSSDEMHIGARQREYFTMNASNPLPVHFNANGDEADFQPVQAQEEQSQEEQGPDPQLSFEEDMVDEADSFESMGYDSSSTSDISSISVDSFDGDDYEEDGGIQLGQLADEEFEMSLRDVLALWHNTWHNSQASCDDLLQKLHRFHPELPLCARALVHTPRSVEIKEMAPGSYYHRGLERGLRHVLSPYSVDLVDANLGIYVAIDGVSLTNSSCSQFWPIVGLIPSLKTSPPFEIGIYWGLSKPNDSNIFLKQTIDEAEKLSKNGMIWKGRKTLVFIKAFIADAPARAWLTCTKSHSSPLHGCSKCDGFGINSGALRTDHSFRTKKDALHHHRSSIIENLRYLDCVKSVPLDAMHLAELGIMKRMAEYIFKTDKRSITIPNVSLNPATIRAFNAALTALRPFISRHDFARKPPKNIRDISRFKATEFRQLLHYTGVVLFKQFLSPSVYHHFLRFHIGIRLLSSHPWCVQFNAYANSLLSDFVKFSKDFFTDSFICYNLHSLLHIALDVLNLGSLYSFSAYFAENFYGFLKKFLKKNDKPLQQLARRLCERNALSHFNNQSAGRRADDVVKFSLRHRRGPLVENCKGLQFKRAVKEGSWTLKCTGEDDCVYLNDLTVVQILNFVQHNNTNIIIGRKFLSKMDYYTLPLPSSTIHEYLVSNPSPNLEAWDMKCIKFKAVKLPSRHPNNDNSYYVAPKFMQ